VIFIVTTTISISLVWESVREKENQGLESFMLHFTLLLWFIVLDKNNNSHQTMSLILASLFTLGL